MAKTNTGEDIEVDVVHVVNEVQKEEPAIKDDEPGEGASQEGISAVAQFDQLVANRGVLTTSETERKFLDFVKGNAIVSSSLRADRAEAEQEYLCQRVALANQEAARLRAALEKTRLELQVEAELKKKAEKERNLLDQKFADLRQLIIGGAGERALLLDMQKILEGTEEQVRGERLSSAKGMPRRSSCSPPHLLDRRMEEHMTVADLENLDNMEGQKKRARSKSVGFQEDLPTRATSSIPDTLDSNGAGSHDMEQKTILKSEKCGLCGERMKFGKVQLRCSGCRMTIHANCANLMTRSCPMLETRKEKPMPTTLKNQRFASPMLR